MKSWLDYWNAPNKIYVNSRHQRAHYEIVFASLKAYLPTGPGRVILDWGCGDALAATRMAAHGDVLLFDGAPNTRDRLRDRYRDHPHVKVVDEAGLNNVAPGSVDLILVISVLQYLNEPQLQEAFAVFRRLLKDDGRLLIGDVIDPTTSTHAHVRSFLTFALRGGFFLAALGGLAMTFFSSYRQLERDAGFRQFSQSEFLAWLDRNGFDGKRLARNVSVSQLRSSYLARKNKPSNTVATAAVHSGSR